MKRGTPETLLRSNYWVNDSNPQSAPKSCGLSVINPQNLPRLALLAAALVNIAYLLNGGFFYIDPSNRVNFGGCFTWGNLFSHCINGMIISLVSVLLASFFILKDCVMCAFSSMTWIRWMQVVEGATFLILSVWWATSAALFYITVQNVKNAGMSAAAGNSSVPAPDLSQNAMAASGMVIPVALGFSMLGLSFACLVCTGIWLFIYSFS